MDGTCPAHLPLRELVSPPRFRKYRDYATFNLGIPEHEADQSASRLYMWNASVAAAYMPSIALAEVIVRNSMNMTICDHFGVSPKTGWHTLVDCGATQPPWSTSAELLDPPLKLKQRDADELVQAFSKIKRRFSRQSERAYTMPSGDDMVGGSSLGSWLTLVDKGVPRNSQLNYHDTIWLPYLHRAFPNFEGPRGSLLNKLRQFQELRNKCAHHEPLLKDSRWHKKKVQLIIQIARYVNADVADYIEESQQITYVVDQCGAYLSGECYL